jgi:hypothetical protein
MIRSLFDQIGLIANDKREFLRNPSERVRVHVVKIKVAQILEALEEKPSVKTTFQYD